MGNPLDNPCVSPYGRVVAIMAMCCLVAGGSCVALVFFSPLRHQIQLSRKEYRGMPFWAHFDTDPADLARALGCGLVSGVCFGIYLSYINTHPDDDRERRLADLQRAMEENADTAGKDGRWDDQARFQREVADIKRLRGLS